jgi:hypothetical protein
VIWRKALRFSALRLLGEMCIVKLADDGPTLVKHLRKGCSRGRFNLLSTNRAPIEDARLDWAAPVRGILPPDLASGERTF